MMYFPIYSCCECSELHEDPGDTYDTRSEAREQGLYGAQFHVCDIEARAAGERSPVAILVGKRFF